MRVSAMLFASLLKAIVRDGSFHLVDSRGKIHKIGDGSIPTCTVRLWKRKLDYSLVLNPPLTVPEAYMNGTLTIEEGTIYDFLDIAARNLRHLEKTLLYRLVRIFDFTNFWLGSQQHNYASKHCFRNEIKHF